LRLDLNKFGEMAAMPTFARSHARRCDRRQARGWGHDGPVCSAEAL